MGLADAQIGSGAFRRDPAIAVVICTRDRPRALLETLDSIWTQTRRPDELIIIDDGQLPDRVPDDIAARCRGLGIKWQYRRTESPGLTKARNLAADIAASDVLQYLDDDVTCEPGLLAEVVRLMRDSSAAGVTATVIEPAFAGLSARLYQLGYAVAGWWKIRPIGGPAGPPPAVLARPEEAVPARWLSGAAMAVRRDIVRALRFDESLAEYGLGEDREFGYRLASRFWLLQARRASVVHRREAGRRTDSRRLGFMTSYNYLRILRRTCRLHVGEWLLVGWSFTVLAAMHVVWGLLGNRRAHFGELRGMLAGVLAAWDERRTERERGLVREGILAPAGPAGLVREGILAPAGLAPVRADENGSAGASPSRYYERGFSHEGFSHGGFSHQRVRQRTSRRPPSPVRVLFVTTNLDPGGAELMLVSLVKHLPRCGVQPFVLCLKAAGALAGQCRSSGTPVLERLLRHKADFAVVPRIREIIKKSGINVVTIAHSGGDRMFWGTLAARAAGLPVVVWSHWFPTPADRHVEPVNRMLYPFVDRFVALGRRHRLALSRHAYVPAGRIAVIPNAIELDAFIGWSSRAEARARLELAEDQVAIALIANFRPEKRHDVFIEAARRLAAGYPHSRFLVIGDGPNRDAVRRAAAASGLSSDVLRLLGRRTDVAELLPGLDVCCLCSEIECSSVTIMEAAAAGCAFIGPDVGCISEHVEHRRTGLLIKPADVASLTDAIAELCDDPALRRRLADAAHEKAVREYGVDRMAAAFADLFAGLSG